MGSTVKSRPNHYEVLGLAPAASSEEIAQAFAEQLNPLRPRAFGSLAEVTVAFETLRDRAKREAYDIASGLKPKPTPPAPEVPAEWAPFLIRASARPGVQPAPAPMPRPAPQVVARPQPEPIAEQKISPFEAARRERIRLPTHEVHLDPMPAAEEPRRPEPTAIPAFEPRTGTDQLHFAETGRFRIEGNAPFQWKLPALAAGAMVFAIGIGAWTGLEAGNDNEQVHSEQAATLKIPPAKPLPVITDSLPAAASSTEEPQRRTRVADAVPRTVRERLPLDITLPDEQPVEAMAEQPAAAAEQLAAETPSIAPTPASLPLPNSVIARTIGRIGYPCGQVAGATALGSGAFKVTCTSGHSYRAAPVRGRYRFRRM
jgi:hypothetical protein